MLAALFAALMAALESFQHRSFRFALAILTYHRKVSANPQVPCQVAAQTCRAGTSIGANLAEAKSAYSRRDLAAKYAIVLREAHECHYWLRLVRTDQPGLAADTDPLIEEVDQLIAMLTTTEKNYERRPANSNL
jgi:four helix bundle protein